MLLTELKIGQRAVVSEITNVADFTRRRICEIGFVPGYEVQLDSFPLDEKAPWLFEVGPSPLEEDTSSLIGLITSEAVLVECQIQE